MNHHKEQLPEYGSEASFPLSKIHRRKFGGEQDKTKSSADEDILSESLSHEYPQNVQAHVNSEDSILTADVSTREVYTPASGSIPRPHLDFLTRSSCVIKSDNYGHIRALSPCHQNDVSEFSKLQLQMASANQVSKAKMVEKENLVSASRNQPIISVPGPLSEVSSINYHLAGDRGRVSQDQYEPVGFTEAVHLEPLEIKHNDIGFSEVLDCPSMDIPYEIVTSETETTPHDCPRRLRGNIPSQDDRQHMQSVTEAAQQGADQNVQYEPLTLRQTSRALSPLVLRETSPPKEVVLSPAFIPHVTLLQGPTVTDPVHRPLAGSNWESAFYRVSPAHQCKDETEPRPPPPPYSECVQFLSSTSSGLQPLVPKSSLKIGQQLHGQTESVAHVSADGMNLCTLCSQMKPLGRGYSKFPVAITSGPQTSSISGSRSNFQVHVGENRRPEVVENDHQLLAFIACLFCWPVGLVAIYYSNMCQMLKAEGNHEQAHIYARHTFILSSLALCSGTIIYIIMFVYQKTI